MRSIFFLLSLLLSVGGSMAETPYAGSKSCRACHETFYERWSTSFHGLAMQPFSADFAQRNLSQQTDEIKIGENAYRVDLTPGTEGMRERGPTSETLLPIAHVMGGKNVYYFLTPTARGMFQTLPLAYDTHRREWFDMALSGLRHAGSRQDRPLNWRDRPYTFNTSCYACHVSQLSTNYDEKTDSYRTVWAEPGINCETCHGPGAAHAKAFTEAAAGVTPPLQLLSTKTFSKEQTNAMCASCHAKVQPVTVRFQPGETFFDHFGLATLEDQDFYPDGRDLGENYTYTGWRMSPCAQSGQLDCVFCHTSSGRYRFNEPGHANDACAPCHQDKVDAPAAHTHHKPDGEGGKCIACHLPKTAFARMVRHDHSMLPPAPAATLRFQSPNACTLCHADKDAAWADHAVREWHTNDYQAPVLERGDLVAAARRRDWSRLPAMLAYIVRPNRDEVTAASLLRLSMAAGAPEKIPALVKALKDSSPLVRACAAEALDGCLTRESAAALLEATRDAYRLVRVRAASTLSSLPPGDLEPDQRAALAKAAEEFEASLHARGDDFGSRFNLGNLYAGRGEYGNAVAEYEKAVSLNPDYVAPLVNLGLLYSQHGEPDKAEDALRTAVRTEPRNAPAQFNLGLLLAENGKTAEAETCLRKALESDPRMAQAAYNLGVLLLSQEPPEGLDWCKKAWELEPGEPKYGYTLAFYQARAGDDAAAIATLSDLFARGVADADTCMLLGSIYERQGARDKAREMYQRAAGMR